LLLLLFFVVVVVVRAFTIGSFHTAFLQIPSLIQNHMRDIQDKDINVIVIHFLLSSVLLHARHTVPKLPGQR
jgi:hypothetical protein